LQSARARLSHTTDNYLIACQYLASTCAKPPQPSNQQSHQLALSTIDLELSSLTQEEERIQKGREVLTDAHKRPKMAAPIYSLSLEILALISFEVTCDHTHNDCMPVLPSPMTLSTVCKLWRNLAINCRSLWTYLDLVIGGKIYKIHYPHGKTWAERSQGAPIYVHIRQDRLQLGHDSNGSDGDTDDSDDDMDSEDSDDIADNAESEVLSVFIPIKSQIYSLELVSSWRWQRLLSSLLAQLMNLSKFPLPIKVLRILHDHECGGPLKIEVPSPSGMTHTLPENCKAFFSSLEVLDLRNAFASWNNMVLTNLVELRLESVAPSSTW
jgi:hypothetical protein